MLSTLQLTHANACLIGVAWGDDHPDDLYCLWVRPDWCWLLQIPLWNVIYRPDKLGCRKLRLIEENQIDFYNDILICCISNYFGCSNIKYVWTKKAKVEPRNPQKKLVF